MYRVGIGWDQHGLEAGRELYLGCVHFRGADKGLKGHSDADVVTHAIVDALFGAMAVGDIGEHFPDTDPAFKGFPGSRFLHLARMTLAKHGYDVVNIDCTVMSDAVRLGDRKADMAGEIAHHLDVDVSQISIKATTWEGFGPVGRGEIIACQAVVMIEGGE